MTKKEEWEALIAAQRARLAPPGLVPRADATQLSGLEFLRKLLAGEVPSIPMSHTLNFWPIEFEPGRAVFMGIPTGAFYNPLGTVHGGWITSILDSTLGCSVNTTLERGQNYTTVELKVNFVRAVFDSTGPVRAEANVIHRGRQILTAEGQLRDSDDKLLAHATTTCLMLKS
jgi:uncharacterized protein (TIGR00369 family)